MADTKATGTRESKKRGGVKTEKIRILHGSVKIDRTGGEKISVDFEILVTGVDGKVKVDCPVSIYGSDLTILAFPQKTNEEGKITYTHKASLDQIGKKLTIRAQIDKSPAEAFDTVDLFPSFGKGWIKHYLNLIQNGKNKKEKIGLYALKTLSFIGVPCYLLAYVGPRINLLVGMALAVLIYFRSKSKVRIFYGLGAIAVSLLFPTFFTESLFFATVYVLTVGFFFYLIEELTYSLEAEEKDGRKEIKWKKMFNFYPKIPAAICLLAIIVHILLIAGHFIPGAGIKYQSGVAYSAYEFFQVGTTNSNSMTSHVADILDWAVALIILMLYAAPDELIAMFAGKTGEAFSTGRVVERFVFFKEISDWVRKFIRGSK